MTVHLPDDLESSIREVVQHGQFASVDDAMAEAARLLLRQVQHGQSRDSSPTPADVGHPADAATRKPIWERILERTATIPDEEWDKLPVDGAEQHDHYIYGTPKRPPTP
jgi:Arc/MetJ-type ribon-helix-helix transcriptional regulator